MESREGEGEGGLLCITEGIVRAEGCAMAWETRSGGQGATWSLGARMGAAFAAWESAGRWRRVTRWQGIDGDLTEDGVGQARPMPSIGVTDTRASIGGLRPRRDLTRHVRDARATAAVGRDAGGAWRGSRWSCAREGCLGGPRPLVRGGGGTAAGAGAAAPATGRPVRPPAPPAKVRRVGFG